MRSTGGPAALAATLRTIAAIGYRNVELGIGASDDPAAVRRLLDAQGLDAVSRHVRMADVFSNWRGVLTECRILGNRQIVCDEVPPSERATLDGYRRVAELLNSAGQITQWATVQLAVRPHADDLRARGGMVPYEVLLANTSPALVKFQLDLSMMAAAKRDPVEDFARYRDRFVSVHIDAEAAASPESPDELVKVLGAARRAGVQQIFVRDEQMDPAGARAKAAFTYLSKLQL